MLLSYKEFTIHIQNELQKKRRLPQIETCERRPCDHFNVGSNTSNAVRVHGVNRYVSMYRPANAVRSKSNRFNSAYAVQTHLYCSPHIVLLLSSRMSFARHKEW
jgi:hypothetical protein